MSQRGSAMSHKGSAMSHRSSVIRRKGLCSKKWTRHRHRHHHHHSHCIIARQQYFITTSICTNHHYVCTYLHQDVFVTTNTSSSPSMPSVTRSTAMTTRVRSYFDSDRFGRRANPIVRPCPFKPSLRDQWAKFACPRVLSARRWITRTLFGSHTSCTSLPS